MVTVYVIWDKLAEIIIRIYTTYEAAAQYMDREAINDSDHSILRHDLYD